MVIVDIVDARTRRSVWRGSVQARVDLELSDSLRRERVNMATDRNFDLTTIEMSIPLRERQINGKQLQVCLSRYNGTTVKQRVSNACIIRKG